jgi:hypothetical protein
MNTNDIYNNLIESSSCKFKELQDELHNTYITKLVLYNNLLEYRDTLNKCISKYSKSNNHCNIDNLFKYEDKEKGSITLSSKDILDEDELKNHNIIATYNSFYYICTKKIARLKDYIQYYLMICKLPYSVYTTIIKRTNKSIANHILLGERYGFGQMLSFLEICIKDRSFSKTVVDFGKTNAFKKELLAKGIPLYDNKTGKGEKYLIYHTEDNYAFFYWRKAECHIANSVMYSFKATDFTNGKCRKIEEFYKKVTSINEILESEQIGNMNKLQAILRFDPSYKLKYRNGI